MSIKLPALIPDRASASGFRVHYLSVEIDAELARTLTIEDEEGPTAIRMRRLAAKIRQADLQRLAQLTWADKDLIIQALIISASLSEGHGENV